MLICISWSSNTQASSLLQPTFALLDQCLEATNQPSFHGIPSCHTCMHALLTAASVPLWPACRLPCTPSFTTGRLAALAQANAIILPSLDHAATLQTALHKLSYAMQASQCAIFVRGSVVVATPEYVPSYQQLK